MVPKDWPTGIAAPVVVPTSALPHEAVAWTKRDKVWAGDPPWVELGASLQWAQFRRAVEILVARGSRVFVVVGP